MPPTPPVALITGANTGIGRVTARELARAGYRVFLACRSLERTRPVLAEMAAVAPSVPAEWLALDLADLASVRHCAQEFLARGLPLHLLINNAGLAAAGGATAQGFERAFGTNHLGHFLLTKLLLPRLRDSASARVVTVASRAHERAAGIPWETLRAPQRSLLGWPEYSVSKLANVLFSAELARRLQGTGVTTYALHPGVVASDIWRRVPQPLRWLMTRRMISIEEGARTTLHCALAPELAAESGGYYVRSAKRTPSVWAQDAALAAELWQRSEAWVEPFAGAGSGSLAG